MAPRRSYESKRRLDHIDVAAHDGKEPRERRAGVDAQRRARLSQAGTIALPRAPRLQEGDVAAVRGGGGERQTEEQLAHMNDAIVAASLTSAHSRVKREKSGGVARTTANGESLDERPKQGRALGVGGGSERVDVANIGVTIALVGNEPLQKERRTGGVWSATEPTEKSSAACQIKCAVRPASYSRRNESIDGFVSLNSSSSSSSLSTSSSSTLSSAWSARAMAR
jgi:hypothetical protein